MPVYDKEEIKQWCTDNLFGPRVVEGIAIPLAPTQEAVLKIAIEIIMKWEASHERILWLVDEPQKGG